MQTYRGASNSISQVLKAILSPSPLPLVECKLAMQALHNFSWLTSDRCSPSSLPTTDWLYAKLAAAAVHVHLKIPAIKTSKTMLYIIV